MATSSLNVVDICVKNSEYVFSSVDSLRSFLDITHRPGQCVIYVSRGRNGPQCSQTLSQYRKNQFEDLVSKLSRVAFLSDAAGKLMKELSSAAVCLQSHRHRGDDVYKTWCTKLWGQYLVLHGIRTAETIPTLFTKEAWVKTLGDIKQRQQPETSNDAGVGHAEVAPVTATEEDEDSREDQDDNDNILDEDVGDLPELCPTPDISTSDFVSRPQDPWVPPLPGSLSLESRQTVPVESPQSGTFAQPRRAKLAVFRDPEKAAPPEASPVPCGTQSDRLALKPLDKNAPINRATKPTPTLDAVARLTLLFNRLRPFRSRRIDASTNVHRLGLGLAALSIDHATEAEGIADTSQLSIEGENQTRQIPDVAADNSIIVSTRATDDQDEQDPIHGVSSPVDKVAHLIDVVSTAKPNTNPVSGYCPYRSNVDKTPGLKECLLRMQKNVGIGLRSSGHIYILRHKGSLFPIYKVGYAKSDKTEKPQDDRVVARRKAWDKCGTEMEEVDRWPVNCKAIQKIESLIHLTLDQWRRIQNPPCSPCVSRGKGGKHNEWFEVGLEVITSVIEMWISFANADVVPYSDDGRLIDPWYTRAEVELKKKKRKDQRMEIADWLMSFSPRADSAG